MLRFYSDWSVLLPLDGCENPWSNKVVCMVGMSKRGGGERRGGGAEQEFRWVQLHTTAKRTPCPPWPGGTGTSPTSLVPKRQTHLCQWGALLICCNTEHTAQQKTDHTNPNPNLARLSFTESQARALIHSHQAWRHDTQSSVELKHVNSVIATSKSTAP